MPRKKKLPPTMAEKMYSSLLEIEKNQLNLHHQLVRLVNLQKINNRILINLAEVTNRNKMVNEQWGESIRKESENV